MRLPGRPGKRNARDGAAPAGFTTEDTEITENVNRESRVNSHGSGTGRRAFP